MSDLAGPLIAQIRAQVDAHPNDDDLLADLTNAVITDEADIEHIITFLDESSSGVHRRFANDLRRAFETVLSDTLAEIEAELGFPPVGLYEAVLDMYDIPGFSEELHGIVTLNYDDYIERAIHNFDRGVDLGIRVPQGEQHDQRHKVLKLHGSFDWRHQWPISHREADGEPLWIPPGIQKAKHGYPFNLLWGQARELLDCDVVRVVGCRLGANDWDLISLLFTTCHTNMERRRPFRLELINSPGNARIVRKSYPYLNPLSIWETDPVGPRLVSEKLGAEEPRAFDSLKPEEQQALDEVHDDNWFRTWLIHMAEAIFEECGSVQTPRGVLQSLMEAQ